MSNWKICDDTDNNYKRTKHTEVGNRSGEGFAPSFFSIFLFFSRLLLNAMTALIPIRIDYRFSMFYTFTFLFKNSSLNILAFSSVDESPVSWHLALKTSVWSESSKRTEMLWDELSCPAVVPPSFFFILSSCFSIFFSTSKLVPVASLINV